MKIRLLAAVLSSLFMLGALTGCSEQITTTEETESGTVATGRVNSDGGAVVATGQGVTGGPGETIAPGATSTAPKNDNSSGGQATTMAGAATTAGKGTATTTTAGDSKPGPAVKIDDKETSDTLTLNKIHYMGAWKTSEDSLMYGGSNHYIWDIGSFFEFKFNGVQFELWSELAPHGGIAYVQIDGGAKVEVDFYGAAAEYPYKNYVSPMLAKGEHTVKVTSSGKWNPDCANRSEGCCISLDYLVVR